MRLRGFITKHKTLFISLSFLVAFSVGVSYAAPLVSPYTPGQTLDPQCAPGDSNCYVANQYASASDVSSSINIATWGDSLTAGGQDGGQPYPFQLAALTGYNVYNGGIGGQTSTQIAARMVADTAKHSWPTIIWAGRNNHNSPATVEADIASMVAALDSNTKYIILGVTNGNTETSGTSDYNNIIQINTYLAATYGNRFIDIRSYLVSLYNPASPQDVTDHNNDVIPTSLRYDWQHLNTAGYGDVANEIMTKLSILEPSNSLILTTSSASGFNNTNMPQLNLAIGGKYNIGGTQVLYLPDQSVYTGTMFLGNGGGVLTHSTGTDGMYDTFLGASSGLDNTTGGSNTGVGYGSLNVNTSGNSNTALGYLAMLTNSTGYNNTAVGANALRLNSAGVNNIAIGLNALFNNTGNSNTAIGVNALQANLGGGSDIAIGQNAASSNTTGGFNTALGNSALQYNTTGSYNVTLGYGAGTGITTGSNVSSNTLIGFNAGNGILTGANNNTLIGFSAGANLTTGAGNIILGYNLSAPSATANNQLDIGNIIYGTGISGSGSAVSPGFIGIGTSTPSSRLDITSLSLGGSQSTTTSGISVNNTTAAALGAQQVSPALRWTGQGWGTTAGTSQAVSFRAYVTPIQGTVPTGYLGFGSSVNGGAFNDNQLVLTSGGYVGIANTSPAVLLTVGSSSVTTGTTVATFQNAGGTCSVVPSTSGGITCSSDMNLKKNITNLSDNSAWSFNTNITPASQSVLDKVLALNPVDYNWNVEQGADPKHAGFIAQEVRQVFPDLVTQDPSTHLLSLNYTGLVPYTVEAIKEMNMTMKALPTFDDQTLTQNIETFLEGIAHGIAKINTVTTQNLCVTDSDADTNPVCLTKAQLQQLLQNQAQQSNPNAPMTTTVTNDQSSDDQTAVQSPEVAAPETTSPASDQTPQ